MACSCFVEPQQEHGEQLFGLYLSYAAGEAATGKSNVDSRKKYDNSPHFSKTSIAAPPDPAALPGKQLLLRPEPEQLFGVSCKSSCAARAQRLGTAATQAWDSCPGGLTRTIIRFSPKTQQCCQGTADFPGVKPLHRRLNPNNCGT